MAETERLPLKSLVGQTISRVEHDGQYIAIFNERHEKIATAEANAFFDADGMYFLNNEGDGLAV